MTSTLNNNLHSEIANLNSNLPNLGKYSRKGLLWSKSFLSFNKDDHINIRQLNLLQILARKFLGMYQDTTLNNVIPHWNDYQIKHGNVCPELNEKLASLWLKNHSPVVSALKQHKYTISLDNIRENATYYSFNELTKKFS